MFTHEQIWGAIDALAIHHGFSPSALAKRAGLDATSFNKSKRINAEGRQRWPSTESIAKILTATGEPLEAFTRRLIDVAEQPHPRAQLIGDVRRRRGRADGTMPGLYAST